MDTDQIGNIPSHCPVCHGDLLATRLECASCGTEVNGVFRLSALASLPEPHAALLDMFLRARGNVKEMERDLGLSYPTVRARLEEALQAAGFDREAPRRSNDEEAISPAVDAVWEARLGADLAQRMVERVQERLAEWQLGGRHPDRAGDLAARRAEVLDRLESGEIAADEAAALLRELKTRRER